MENTNKSSDEVKEVVKAKKAHPDAKAWHTFQLETIQKTPERLEDAAKFLSGMISISLTVYLKLSSEPAVAPYEKYLEVAILFTWLFSLAISFFVLFPFRYHYAEQSSRSIRDMHSRAIKVKVRFLAASVLLYLTALVLLSVKQFLI